MSTLAAAPNVIKAQSRRGSGHPDPRVNQCVGRNKYECPAVVLLGGSGSGASVT